MKLKTKRTTSRLASILVVLLLVFSPSGCQFDSPTSQVPTAAPTPSGTPPAPVNTPEIPYELISQESLFAYLEDLTAIQAYSGWRNSASRGEAEALEYVEETLSAFSYLQEQGLELERQSFHVYLSTEIRDTSLTLSVDGEEFTVPAEGLRGNRFDRNLVVYFDSDGALNDSNPDPMTAAGAIVIVQDEDTLYELTAKEYKDRILLLDYSLIDRGASPASGDSQLGANENSSRLVEMVNQGLAGIVLVTRFSNNSWQSHGMGVGEGGSVFGWDKPLRRIPVLYTRIEDLGPVGIEAWEDLGRVEAAQLTLDADAFFPGESGNLIARIPGADPSKAVILGAHIDSPNSPGALDDGSGSAVLLEVARVLNDARLQPPVDVYLAWFGSEELGVYGSAHFVTTHQELLDRTLAMVQMDGLGSPVEGTTCNIAMVLASYDRFGDDRLLLPDFLSSAVASQGLSPEPYIEHGLASDHNNFEAFDVPNMDLMYVNTGKLHAGAPPIHAFVHWHDPYETVDLVRPVGTAFVDMTKMMLAAALEIGYTQPDLRVPPAPSRRALIVASHTEAFGITALREMGTALSWEGFDVDLVPYGQAVTSADLEEAGIVILPPALNAPGHAPEEWSDSELAALQGYVEAGGFLVVVNSAHDYASTILLNSLNKNARSANALLEPMGVRFKFGGTGSDDSAQAVAEHPLLADATYLTLHGENSVAFSMEDGLVLIGGAGLPLAGLVDFGTRGGQVLVIGEPGLLQESSSGARNLQFVMNIAHYARMR